jgi:septal ring factor EnvC (AmiA/AmiB activator)
MSTKQNSQQVAKTIAHVNSRLSELARPIAELHNEEAVLKMRIETIEQDIASRDWIFSGHRPRGSSESVSQAKQTRRQLHIEL